MKFFSKTLVASAFLFAAMNLAHADSIVYQSKFVNESALTYNTTYTLDLIGSGIDEVAAQATYSSATIAATSFLDGVAATGTIVVTSTQNLAGARASATITMPTTANLTKSVGASDTLTISSNTDLTNVSFRINKITFQNGVDWFSQDVASNTAINIANAINRVLPDGCTAQAIGSIVYTTATTTGNVGNSYALEVTTTALKANSVYFTGGQELPLLNAVVTVNGIKLLNGSDWSTTDTSSGTATNLATAINTINYLPYGTSVPTNLYTTSVTGGTVTVTCVTTGTICNTFTLASSTSAIALSSAVFTGGANNAVITINNITLTQGTDWFQNVLATTTAKSITDAINSTTGARGTMLTSIATATWAAGSSTVFTTATYVGSLTNYYQITTSTSALTVVGMTGGVDTAISTTTSIITKTAHGLTTGLAVLFTKTAAGTSPANLVANTTYYAIKVDANNFKLATSQALATAGTNITISTQNIQGKGSFTLTPLAYAGTPSFKWQVSNDGVNFGDITASVNNVTISSVTMTSAAAATSVWDFDGINYRYLRLNFVAPTTGGVTLSVPVVGRRRWSPLP